MLEQSFRHYYQRILVDRCARRCYTKVTPNQITYWAGISGVCTIPCLYWHLPILACACILISGFLDTLDGTVARLNHISSNFGSALDITMDRVVEFAIMFGLFLFKPEAGLIVMLMLGSSLFCITTFLVVGIFTPNDGHKSFHYSSGLMERAEAFVFFILMILFPQTYILLGISYTILVALTGIIRLKQFKQFCDSQHI